MRIHDAISAYLGIEVENVVSVVERAPTLYRRYLVPKKRGGSREIYHPAKETKAVQSAAIDLLYQDDLHLECCTGYVRGMSSPLLRNASTHASNPFLLRLDFTDFFPSIKPDDFRSVCGSKLRLSDRGLEDDDLEFLRKLFFVYNGRYGWFLGIGAPSSPFVSNWVMLDLDQEISTICSRMGCMYTRYADDLCISTTSKDQLLEAEHRVRAVVGSAAHPRLSFNDRKRTLASKWSRRRVTGLTITPTGQVKVPRSTKRRLRAFLNAYKTGRITAEERAMLAGYLGFLNDCEPGYMSNLVLKFGANTVNKAFKGI